MTEIRLQIDEVTIHVFCDDDEAIFALHEANQRGVPLGGPYSARYDKAHTDPGEDHLHVFMKNNQIFAINKSGTAHDHSHGTHIPNRVVKGIQKAFPQIQLPDDNLIECIGVLDEMRWLTEAASEEAT
jgi:hypothetical protein